MNRINIILQNPQAPTPPTPPTPLVIGETTIMLSNTQTYQKGKVRRQNYVRAINANDLTTNMFPYHTMNLDVPTRVTHVELIDAIEIFDNGNTDTYDFQPVSTTTEPIDIRICRCYHNNGVYDYSTLEIGHIFYIDSLIPNTLTDYINGEQIVCFGLQDWHNPIELRFKYFYANGTDSGDDYAKVTIVNTAANKDSYLEMALLPVKIYVGKDMITPITYNMIINAFENHMQSYNGDTNIQDFLESNFNNPTHISQNFGTNLVTYGLRFLNKVYILDSSDPNNHIGYINDERLKVQNEPIIYGQGIDHKVLKLGSLTYNSFGLTSDDYIELLFGLEALMYGSIFFSNNDSDSI